MKLRVIPLIPLIFLTRVAAVAAPCDRVVSLAPSVTEVVFDLGLGSKVVGVTRYCRFPPEAQNIPRVGGFYDISLESLVSSRPTIVIGLRENREVLGSAQRLGMATHEVDHSTVDGIKRSLESIANTCEVSRIGADKVAALERRERELKSSMRGVPPYKTLVAVGRTREGSSVSGVYVSGKDGFYTGVLELLGMKNVNQDSTVAIPTLSPEGLIALAPEVIVEISSVDEPPEVGGTADLWGRYATIPAVKDKRVFTLREDYASIPGPRYILVAEELARKIKGGAQ